MSAFPNILGNEELREHLSRDVRAGTLSHAYIIEGPKGCGKHTLAREIAAALSCEHARDTSMTLPCTLCLPCRKILGGKSPDVITIGREDGKAQLGVDVIRNMREDVRLLPNDLDVKVYIIEDAHTMNIQAQNAFLLTLEEPPKFVVFLLLCESAQPMLETIKSRAPILRMRPLGQDVLRDSLVEHNADARALSKNDPEEFEEILKLSNGFMGQAIELLDAKRREPRLAARHLAKEFLLYLTERKSGRRSIDILGSFSQKREEIREQLSEIESAARDLVVIKKCENAPLCFFTGEDEAAELSFKFKTSALIAVIEAAGRAKARLAGNANVRLTLYALAIDCGLL